MNRSLAAWMLTVLVAGSAFLFVPTARRAVAADEEGKKSSATFEVYKDKGGDYRWRLRTQNTKVIASGGQSFSSKQSCVDSIESVKRHAADAPIKEVSE